MSLTKVKALAEWFVFPFYDNNNISGDYTSQTPIDFDWYNPHPYQRTTGITKKT